MAKPVITDKPIIDQAEFNGVKIWRKEGGSIEVSDTNYPSMKAALQDIAAKAGIKLEEGWNTQYAGWYLIQQLKHKESVSKSINNRSAEQLKEESKVNISTDKEKVVADLEFSGTNNGKQNNDGQDSAMVVQNVFPGASDGYKLILEIKPKFGNVLKLSTTICGKYIKDAVCWGDFQFTEKYSHFLLEYYASANNIRSEGMGNIALFKKLDSSLGEGFLGPALYIQELNQTHAVLFGSYSMPYVGKSFDPQYKEKEQKRVFKNQLNEIAKLVDYKMEDDWAVDYCVYQIAQQFFLVEPVYIGDYTLVETNNGSSKVLACTNESIFKCSD